MKRLAAAFLVLLMGAAPALALNITADITNINLRPGDRTNLIVSLENTEQIPLDGIITRVELEPYSRFIIVTPHVLYTLPPKETKSVNLPLEVAPQAEQGQYALRVVSRWKELGTEKLKEAFIRLNVSKPSLIDITETRFDPPPVPGRPFTLLVKVRNTGPGDARNIRLNLAYQVSEQQQVQPGQPFSPSVFSQPQLVLVQIPFTPLRDFIGFLEVLRPGEEKTVDFPLVSERAAKTGAYSVPITIQYQNERGDNQEPVKNVVGILLGGGPHLDVAGTRLDPQRVFRGEDYTLSVQLENQGAGEARGVRAQLLPNAAAGGVPPGGGERVDFLGTLRAGDVASAIFDLRATEAGLLRHPLEVSYRDEAGNNYTLRETIPLEVRPAEERSILLAAPAALL
ncbi:MAG: hypothetical protein HY558_00505, partial [Euryarchaeota archaeon]|nr:hypothetical protein [Euryarchaeota archaeon]